MADRFGIDGHKIHYHPQRVGQFLAAGDDWEQLKKIYPIYVEVSPNGACNHRCIFCAVDYIGYKRVMLDTEVYAKCVGEMAAGGVKSIMYAGEGEPLLHRDIAQITAITREAGIDVAFTTNGSYVTELFIDKAVPITSWIKVSINAGTPETYSQIHRTRADHFDIVVRNLGRMIKRREQTKTDCTVGAQCLLLPENAAELKTLATICRDTGIDYLVVKPYSQHLMSNTRRYEAIDYRNFLELERELEALSTDSFSVVFRRRTMEKHISKQVAYPTCLATPFFWAYLMADGSVYSCSAYLEDQRFCLGNINQSSFAEIWEGERRRENVRFVREKLDIADCRRNCRMDEVNRFLTGVRGKNIPHVNFI
ncbi:MAG: radical SAM protein [Deltaproteobacteria bacterium]|nr:radical SAM protein [Deltaproteobacteria bacterium]